MAPTDWVAHAEAYVKADAITAEDVEKADETLLRRLRPPE
jgi:hypothetical protein